MTTVVEKFGGTSVADPERIGAVADRVLEARARNEDVVVVVSAMGKHTDVLAALAEDVNPSGSARERDVLLSSGEQVTISLLAMALQARNQPARSYTGAQVPIITDSRHGSARISSIDPARIRADLDSGHVVIVAGFQGIDPDGNITTLGRGGSDTSAVAIAAALQADECRINTDVDGVYTADPRIVPDARRLDRITVEEMLEFASLGAKVLMSRSVEFAGRYKIPVRVLSSFNPGPGTLITFEEDESMEQASVSGITHDLDEAKVIIRGVPDRTGIASTIFGTVSDADINVDMIVQNIGEDNLTDLTFTVPKGELKSTLALLSPVIKELGASGISGDEHIAKISAVGVGMRSHAGIASSMFRALSEDGINIQMISTSEIKISVVVEDKFAELAVRSLHKAFELGA